MSVFVLKRGDTFPILEVALKNPDGSAHDLTGTSAWQLHIRLSASVVFTRAMVTEGPLGAGVLRYLWVETDWAPVVPTDPALPAPLSTYHTIELPMEYQVTAAATEHMTFPNGRFDTLRIVADVA